MRLALNPIVHEDYHDIALLKLAESVADLTTFTPAYLPALDTDYTGLNEIVFGG